MTRLTTKKLLKIADLLDAMPREVSAFPKVRAAIFGALEDAAELAPDPVRRASWDLIRHVGVFINGTKTPFRELIEDPECKRDPYTGGRLPSYGELISMLDYAIGSADDGKLAAA